MPFYVRAEAFQLHGPCNPKVLMPYSSVLYLEYLTTG